MNDNDRGLFKPAPKAGSMQCPKCKAGTMLASQKDPKVSTCNRCGHSARRQVLR